MIGLSGSQRLSLLMFTLALPLALAVEAQQPRASQLAPANERRPFDREQEEPFLAENTAAMNKMMSDMNVQPTGDVDRDFVAMMVPHHQGAIDMAQALLRHGKNEQLRRLAQEIIVTQQEEIVAMRLAIGQPLPPSVPAPTTIGLPSTQPATSHEVHPPNK